MGSQIIHSEVAAEFEDRPNDGNQDLGLDYTFFREVIEDIRRFRNDQDVAHFRLDDAGLEAVRKKFNDAKMAVSGVVVAYADQLRARHNS